MADLDAVVVGAGLAGLAAARRLTRAGRTVVCVDAADAPGGRVRTDRVEGFLVDRVPRAQPDQAPPALTPPRRPVRLERGLLVCGDHRDDASINGALVSGRRAAEAVLAG